MHTNKTHLNTIGLELLVVILDDTLIQMLIRKLWTINVGIKFGVEPDPKEDYDFFFVGIGTKAAITKWATQSTSS